MRRTPEAQGRGAMFSRWEVGTRYDLRDMLGSGSYGDVAGAYDHVKERRVAIKRIEDVFCNRVDAMRLVREMTILRQLQHGNTGNTVESRLTGGSRSTHYLQQAFGLVSKSDTPPATTVHTYSRLRNRTAANPPSPRWGKTTPTAMGNGWRKTPPQKPQKGINATNNITIYKL